MRLTLTPAALTSEMLLGITFSIVASIHTPVPHVVPAFSYTI